jgi:hypothetical protein
VGDPKTVPGNTTRILSAGIVVVAFVVVDIVFQLQALAQGRDKSTTVAREVVNGCLWFDPSPNWAGREVSWIAQFADGKRELEQVAPDPADSWGPMLINQDPS